MTEENFSKGFRLKNIDETINYFVEKIDQNELMSKIKWKSQNEHFLILVSVITGYISIYGFASLLGIHTGITSSAISSKVCAITAGIEKHKSIIKEKEKRKRSMMKQNC